MPSWSSDDQYCLRMTNNTIHVYKDAGFAKESHSSVKVDNVVAYALEPVRRWCHLLAANRVGVYKPCRKH